jgi:hypothetical protein
MSIKTVIKIVRPDQSAPFFNLSEAALPYVNFISEAVYSGIFTNTTNMYSTDKLTLTRMIIYKDQEAKNAYIADFAAKYPEFNNVRQNYCNEHNHILTITS